MKLNMTYIKVYNFMKTQLRLDDRELYVFAFIYSFHETGKKCTASMSYIARQLDISTKTVMRAINSLKEMGIVTTEKSGKILEFKVNEDGIYRRASELAANKATAPVSDDENDCAFEDEDEDGGEDEDEDKGDGADGGDGDYPTGTYGGNSAHERGEDAYERKTAGKVPKYASNSAEEALYHALCRTYGSELAKEIIKYH